MPRPFPVAIASIAVTLLAACGGDEADTATADPGGAPAGTDGAVTVVAEDVDFGADAYEAEAGAVAFDYVNEGVLEHSLVIEGVDGFRLLVRGRGDTDRGSVDLEPGSYRIFCDIAGHEQAGMVAELEVR